MVISSVDIRVLCRCAAALLENDERWEETCGRRPPWLSIKRHKGRL